MFRFGNPDALQLFWLLPLFLVLSVYLRRRSQKRLQQVVGGKLAPYLTASLSQAKRRFKFILQLSALAFFVIALARPQMGKSLQSVKSAGIEMMILVDVSNSMLAEDVKPSRLQFAKNEVANLLDRMPSDKIGMVAFAGSAVMLSPLTSDKSALKMFLDSLSPESVETQGTDFSKALREAADAFKRGGVNTEEDDAVRVTRVVLVVSDGEDNEAGALEEAKRLVKGEGIRIFSLAFGTEKGGAIPLRDERGYLKGYKKDRGGKTVLSQTKGTILRELAAAGQGSFYHATFGGQQISSLRRDLDRLEKAEFDSSTAMNYDEKYQIFLAIGLFFALLDMWLGERRAEGRIWRGRFEVSKR